MFAENADTALLDNIAGINSKDRISKYTLIFFLLVSI